GTYSDKVRRGTTGDQGVALFSNVDPNSHVLAVTHRAYLTRYFGSIQPEAGERTFVEAVLESAQSKIDGLVVNESGFPLDRVEVSASHYTEGGVTFAASSITGYDGRFSIGVLPGSQNQVGAERLGYALRMLTNVQADTHDLRIVMERSDTAMVSGFVTKGASFDPVTQFSVDSDVIIDEGGVFRVERNVSSVPQTLLFIAEGYDPLPVLVTLDSGDDVDIGQVSLFGQGELNGIVLLQGDDDAALPLGDATVTVAPIDTDIQVQVTEADGLFAFRGLGAGSVRLTVSAPGASLYESDIEISDGEATYVEVLLEQGTYSVSGLVTDGGTQDPLEGVQVQVVERPDLVAISDEAGQYEITGIPLESFGLEATVAGYEDELSPSLDGEAEGAIWDAQMTPSGLRLRLTVSGAPAPAGVPVTLWQKIAANLSAALTAQAAIDTYRTFGVTDEEGSVTFDVEDGDYFVQVPSYQLLPTPVRADAEQSDWETIALPGVTRLDGRISNSDGTPVANTSVWLHSGDQDYSTMQLYHTDGAGNYSIPSVAPRSYALSIIKSVAEQSAQYVREFVGTGSSQQALNVIFPPMAASIVGRLTDENGVGKSGVNIGVENLDAAHRSILAGWVGTDAAGNFSVLGLEAGRHVLRTAWTAEETVFSEPFSLAPGEQKQVNLVAPNIPGQSIQGNMIAGDGGPLGGNFVFATDSFGNQNGNYFSTMDWGYVGPFSVGGLRPGSYRVDLTAMGMRKTSQQVGLQGSVGGLVIPMTRE
ncbi:MAG: hypothetical protein ACI82F_004584, partial [Planctomycetota bacterium]